MRIINIENYLTYDVKTTDGCLFSVFVTDTEHRKSNGDNLKKFRENFTRKTGKDVLRISCNIGGIITEMYPRLGYKLCDDENYRFGSDFH